MARIRTFIAVDISDDIRRRAGSLQQQLARCEAKVKWVTPEDMHITLVFLGEIDERDIVAVCRAAESIAGREPSFHLRVSGVGAFPTTRRPKVVWGGVAEGADALRRLHVPLETELMNQGLYAKEERDYSPHLTLGRVRGERDGNLLAPELPKFRDWEGGTADVGEVLVMSSQLGKEGPEYAILARCPLGAQPKP